VALFVAATTRAQSLVSFRARLSISRERRHKEEQEIVMEFKVHILRWAEKKVLCLEACSVAAALSQRKEASSRSTTHFQAAL
jgi:hypothetical protein